MSKIVLHNVPIETETLIQNFRDRYKDLPMSELDENELLLRKAIRVIDTVNSRNSPHSDLTMIELRRLLNNERGDGRAWVQKLAKISFATPEEAKENLDIIYWFLDDYFAEKAKAFDRTRPVRTYIEYLLTVP